MEKKIILFYDGECNFCNQTVQWIIKRNRTNSIYFAPTQGDFAKQLLVDQLKVDDSIDSLIVYKHNKLYIYSEGALQLAKELDGAWKLLVVLKVVPKFIRDWCYKGFAKRRYKWFGHASTCQIPTPEIRKRFID